MNITLFVNNSDTAVVDKQITNVSTMTGQLKNETSLINPVVLLELDLSNTSNFNYMYIEEFKRYYFVKDIKSVRNGLVEVSGHVDVLMSYAQAIKSNTAIVERQENVYNMYLNDAEFNTNADRRISTKKFPQGFENSDNIFLTVIGGYREVE